jgi:putative restriction endonuclease
MNRITLAYYTKSFARLHVNRTKARGVSPHKICMLLAVIDLYDYDADRSNQILYGQKLLERFRLYFEAVKKPTDHANPYFPFFHLSGDKFWHLQPKPGRELVLAALTTVRSNKGINENIEYATLDTDLHSLLGDRTARHHLAESLVNHWFDRQRAELLEMIQFSSTINSYEHSLRENVEVSEPDPRVTIFVRDQAFRRVVLEAYDYRCAATGERIILPDESAMVEAAHIIPFSETRDDDPRNGLALAPNIHWAMDKNVIAPGPDWCWHVSRKIERRKPANRSLVSLDNQKVILPREQRLWPKREALEWRMDNLLK